MHLHQTAIKVAFLCFPLPLPIIEAETIKMNADAEKSEGGRMNGWRSDLTALQGRGCQETRGRGRREGDCPEQFCARGLNPHWEEIQQKRKMMQVLKATQGLFRFSSSNQRIFHILKPGTYQFQLYTPNTQNKYFIVEGDGDNGLSTAKSANSSVAISLKVEGTINQVIKYNGEYLKLTPKGSQFKSNPDHATHFSLEDHGSGLVVPKVVGGQGLNAELPIGTTGGLVSLGAPTTLYYEKE